MCIQCHKSKPNSANLPVLLERCIKLLGPEAVRNIVTKVTDETKHLMRLHLDDVVEAKAAWVESLLRRPRHQLTHALLTLWAHAFS